jgi:hypothetical protein
LHRKFVKGINIVVRGPADVHALTSGRMKAVNTHGHIWDREQELIVFNACLAYEGYALGVVTLSISQAVKALYFICRVGILSGWFSGSICGHMPFAQRVLDCKGK